jgi:hypothetical protein
MQSLGQIVRRANERGGVDAGTALCLHMLRCGPGATHRERYA